MGGRLRCALGDDGWLFFVLEDMCALVLLRGYSNSLFCFSLSIYFASCVEGVRFYCCKKGRWVFWGREVSRGDSRSSVLSFVLYCVWKSFLESEKRHGIGVF